MKSTSILGSAQLGSMQLGGLSQNFEEFVLHPSMVIQPVKSMMIVINSPRIPSAFTRTPNKEAVTISKQGTGINSVLFTVKETTTPHKYQNSTTQQVSVLVGEVTEDFTIIIKVQTEYSMAQSAATKLYRVPAVTNKTGVLHNIGAETNMQPTPKSTTILQKENEPGGRVVVINNLENAIKAPTVIEKTYVVTTTIGQQGVAFITGPLNRKVYVTVGQ